MLSALSSGVLLSRIEGRKGEECVGEPAADRSFVGDEGGGQAPVEVSGGLKLSICGELSRCPIVENSAGYRKTKGVDVDACAQYGVRLEFLRRSSRSIKGEEWVGKARGDRRLVGGKGLSVEVSSEQKVVKP